MIGISTWSSAEPTGFEMSATSLVTMAARSAIAVATTTASTASVVFDSPSRTPACLATGPSGAGLSGTLCPGSGVVHRSEALSLLGRTCDGYAE
jgi:hypothetical protein